VSIKYDSYEVCDSYPQDTDGFNVSASQGNKLLVIHFNIENNKDEDCNLNLIEDNMTAKITVNDSLSGNGLNTMLANDLTSYYDTIPANTTTDAVILAQLGEDSAQDLTAISVKISATSGSVDIDVK
jgi:NaMN:DMB phosphoribosyltransferase